MRVAQVPETMTAVAIAEPGGPEVLVPREEPVPQPGAGEWLVRVAYAGVNRPDVLQRAGRYPPPPGASPLPGLEISGTVVACGRDAPREIGQRVCALVNGGGYAQYCAVDWRHCLPTPPDLPLAEAAALPETLFTVWHSVFQRGLARDGEILLVHGGTSGIGTIAIKLAKLFGLTAIVTCGSDEKCSAARQLGADRAINYRERDFAQTVRAMTGGRGADVILDMVAGDYTQRNLECLAEDGRLVTIAVLGGARATINMAGLMVRRQTMTGSTLRPRSADFKALLAREIRENVWPAVAEGELRPAMDRVFPLVEAAAAHTRMESGQHVGKIVLEVAGEEA
ncbi:MAG: NAD(P)H-quinone oxidoreductase [Croceibacterium sp.]